MAFENITDMSFGAPVRLDKFLGKLDQSQLLPILLVSLKPDAASRLFDELVAVADGKLTRAEVNGHREFAVNRIGPTF